jgi:hypothetical protein
MKINRPVYSLRLRPEKGVEDPIRALRRALKVLLRQFGLRAIAAHEERGSNDGDDLRD